jgi:hypothetical protein
MIADYKVADPKKAKELEARVLVTLSKYMGE